MLCRDVSRPMLSGIKILSRAPGSWLDNRLYRATAVGLLAAQDVHGSIHQHMCYLRGGDPFLKFQTLNVLQI